MDRSDTPAPLKYRIEQMGPPRLRGGTVSTVQGHGVQRNEPVTGFDSLVLHHPGDNRAARMVEGRVIDGKQNRAFAHIDGRLQEIEYARRLDDGRIRTYGLKADQVLIKRDYILSDPDHDPMSRIGRRVDVPAPVDGVIGARHDREGLIDIHDEIGGKVIARFRHLADIQLRVGDPVSYGQTLGTQSNVATQNTHVHMEMDSHYYPQFRNYVDDLASGRLPLQAELRQGVVARPVIDDGTLRLGQSSEQIKQLQTVMHGQGYRNADGSPLDRDGVYRIGMQGALLDFQHAHGIAQTGDVDPATLRLLPPVQHFEHDRHHYTEPGRLRSLQSQPTPLPDHPDRHAPRIDQPADKAAPVNQRSPQVTYKGDPLLEHLITALACDDPTALSRASRDLAASSAAQLLLEQGRELLAAEQLQQQHLQAPRRHH